MTTINISTPVPLMQEVHAIFADAGFVFAEGELKSTGQPRVFGVVEGCTLEIVGDPEIAWATMVAVIAPDNLELANKNGIRLFALGGALIGRRGAEWAKRMLVEANKHRSAGRVKIGDSLLGWRLMMVVNFQKSTITLKIQRGK